MGQYNYSIIIPHYNCVDLLKRCLASIPLRNDVQVIVVDDNSDESEVLKMKDLECLYPQHTFIFLQKNIGGGAARNIGLKHATGKFVLFADADDFFNYCINNILDEYVDYLGDIVFFNAISLDSNSFLPSIRSWQLDCLHRNYFVNRNKAELCFRFLFGEPWAKMIRRDFINVHNINFEETPLHNDTLFSYMTGFYAQEIKVDNRALYCITIREGSISTNNSIKTQFIRLRIFSQKNKFLRDHQIKVFDEIMLWPFKKFIWDHDWTNLSKCFGIAKQYGFPPLFVMKQLFIKKIFKKNNTNWAD